MCCGKRVDETTVIYTEKEWARLSHLVRHGVENSTKECTVKANVQQACQTFWPTGSPEHVAMRTWGAVGVIRAISGSDACRRPIWTLCFDPVVTRFRHRSWEDEWRWYEHGAVAGWIITIGGDAFSHAFDVAYHVTEVAYQSFRRNNPSLFIAVASALQQIVDALAWEAAFRLNAMTLEDGRTSRYGQPTAPAPVEPLPVPLGPPQRLAPHMRAAMAAAAQAARTEAIRNPPMRPFSGAGVRMGDQPLVEDVTVDDGLIVDADASTLEELPPLEDIPEEDEESMRLRHRAEAQSAADRTLREAFVADAAGSSNDPRPGAGFAHLPNLYEETRLVEDALPHSPQDPFSIGPSHHGRGDGEVEVYDQIPFHGGLTAEDADVLANRDPGGRTVELRGGIGIIGQTHGGTLQDTETQPIRGVVIGPCLGPPLVYKNDAANVEAAVDGRIMPNQKPSEQSKQDARKIGNVTANSIGNSKKFAWLSKERVVAWAESKFHLQDIASKKWTDKRFTQSLHDLLRESDPHFKHKAVIKAERLKEGAFPRLVIADGDSGQIMANVGIKCFEDLLVDWFKDSTMKGASRKKVIARALKRHRANKHSASVEGDGKHWDSTCDTKVRESENTLLAHIMLCLEDYGVVPEVWADAHAKANESPELKLEYKKRLQQLAVKAKLYILNIRRSGHRGTSILNLWVNFINWICSIFIDPERFLDPTCTSGKDVTGIMRWFVANFEGDDSLASLAPRMMRGDKLSILFEEYWRRQGFKMKLVYASDRCEMIGTHFECKNGHLTGEWCPDLPRCLLNMGVTTAPDTIQAAKTGDIDKVKQNAAAAFMCRAYDFAGIIPTMSEKCMLYAKGLKERLSADRELSILVTGCLDMSKSPSVSDVCDEIDQLNAMVSPEDEYANLKRFGYEVIPEELEDFKDFVWDLNTVRDYGSFVASVPATWLPATLPGP